jgi:hypothetical protein
MLLLVFVFSGENVLSQTDYDDSNLDYGTDTLEGQTDPVPIQGFIYDHCASPQIVNFNILHFETFVKMAISFSSEQELIEITNNNTNITTSSVISSDGYISLDLESSYTIFGYNECGERIELKTFETVPIEASAFEASQNLIVQLGRWAEKGENQTKPLYVFLTQTKEISVSELLSFVQYKVLRGSPFSDDLDGDIENFHSTRPWLVDTNRYLDNPGKQLIIEAFQEADEATTQDCNCTVLFSGSLKTTPIAGIKDYGDGTGDIIVDVKQDHNRTYWTDKKAVRWYDLHLAGPATFEQMQSSTIKHNNRNAIGHREHSTSDNSEFNQSSKDARITYLMVCSGNLKLPENCACDREIAVDVFSQAKLTATARKGDQHKNKSTKIGADVKITARYYEFRGSDLNNNIIPLIASSGRATSECDFQVDPEFWNNYMDILTTSIKIYVAAKTGAAGTDSIPFRIKIDSTTIDTTLVGTAGNIAKELMKYLNKYPAMMDSLSTQIKRAIGTPYWSKNTCSTADPLFNLMTTNNYTTYLKPNEQLTLSLQTATSHYMSGAKSWYTHTAIQSDYALATVLLGTNNTTDPTLNCCNPFIAIGVAKGSYDDATAKAYAARGMSTYGLGHDKFQVPTSTGTAIIDKDMWRFAEKKGINCSSTGGLTFKRVNTEESLTAKLIVSSADGTLRVTNQTDETVHYRVLDLLGKVISSKVLLTEGATITQNGLRHGTYIIEFTTPTQQFVKRAVIY